MKIYQHLCPKCHQRKPLTPEFWHRSNTRPTGFQYACKPCMIRMVMEAQQRNPDYYTAYQRIKQREYYRVIPTRSSISAAKRRISAPRRRRAP